jgi:hypothetical protein
VASRPKVICLLASAELDLSLGLRQAVLLLDVLKKRVVGGFSEGIS